MAHEAQVRYSKLVDLKLRATLVKKEYTILAQLSSTNVLYIFSIQQNLPLIRFF